MLGKLGQEQTDCLERAAECRRRAEAAADAERKSFFVDMEIRWLSLARSYEYAEKLGEYLKSERVAMFRKTNSDKP